MSDFTVQKARGGWGVTAGNGILSTHKTKGEAVREANRLEMEPRIRQAGKLWELVVAADVVDTFKGKAAAQKELDAALADLAAQAQDAAANALADAASESAAADEVAPGVPRDRVARLNLMKVESDALRDWRAAGEGDRPATPVIDWNNDPTTKAPRTSSGRAKATPARDEGQEQKMVTLITEGRANGASFKEIAEQLNAAGIPTGRGIPWSDRSTWTKAKRLGIIVK